MPDDQEDQQTADDQSTTAESEEQPLQDEVMNESAGETTGVQEGEGAGLRERTLIVRAGSLTPKASATGRLSFSFETS